jgi:hypothetical protein
MSGLVLITAGLLAYANPRIRHVEDELPDAVVEPAATEPPTGEPVPTLEAAGA